MCSVGAVNDVTHVAIGIGSVLLALALAACGADGTSAPPGATSAAATSLPEQPVPTGDRTEALQEAQRKITDPATPTPPVVTYRCPGEKPFTAQFYNDLDPQAALLTWGADSAVALIDLSGSGAKYSGDDVQFWEHQGQVSVDFRGASFVCTTR